MEQVLDVNIFGASVYARVGTSGFVMVTKDSGERLYKPSEQGIKFLVSEMIECWQRTIGLIINGEVLG